MLAGTVSRGRMSYQKWLLLVFISPELFPVFHCCFQRLPKIIKWWVWIRMLSNTVPCTETRSVWDFVCILRVESLFPTGLQVSCTEALLAFKARYSASCVPGAGAWVWEAQYRARTPPSLVRISELLSSCLFVGHLPGVWVLIMPTHWPPYQHFWDSFLCL